MNNETISDGELLVAQSAIDFLKIKECDGFVCVLEKMLKHCQATKDMERLLRYIIKAHNVSEVDWVAMREAEQLLDSLPPTKGDE